MRHEQPMISSNEKLCFLRPRELPGLSYTFPDMAWQHFISAIFDFSLTVAICFKVPNCSFMNLTTLTAIGSSATPKVPFFSCWVMQFGTSSVIQCDCSWSLLPAPLVVSVDPSVLMRRGRVWYSMWWILGTGGDLAISRV